MTSLRPVTYGRVRAILNQDGLFYRVEDDMVFASFTNGNVRIILDEDDLIIEAQWRGQSHDEADIETMQRLCRECNWNRIGPRAVTVGDDDGVTIETSMRQPVDILLTDQQLYGFWGFCMGATWSFLNEVEKRLPHLVTWEEDDEV